jgi:hypothetical protein
MLQEYKKEFLWSYGFCQLSKNRSPAGVTNFFPKLGTMCTAIKIDSLCVYLSCSIDITTVSYSSIFFLSKGIQQFVWCVYLLSLERVNQATAWQWYGEYRHRQRGDSISLLLFFQSREHKRKVICHTFWKHFHTGVSAWPAQGNCVILAHFPQ